MGNPLPLPLSDLLAASDPLDRDAAWARLLDAHTRVLLRLANSLGGGHDAAMERYLFIIERLREDDYRRLRAFDPDGPAQFTTWLLVVARNLCRDHHRTRFGRDRGTPELRRMERRNLVELSGAVDVDRVADHLPAEAMETVEFRELRKALTESIAELPADDRILLAYWYDDGLTAGEIARLLEFPTSFHVYRRIRALTKTLRSRLTALGYDGSE